MLRLRHFLTVSCTNLSFLRLGHSAFIAAFKAFKAATIAG